MKKLLIKWSIIPCGKRVLEKMNVYYYWNGNIKTQDI